MYVKKAKLVLAALFFLVSVALFMLISLFRRPGSGMAGLVVTPLVLPVAIALLIAGIISIIRAFARPPQEYSPARESGGLKRNISPRAALFCGLSIMIIFIILGASFAAVGLVWVGFWLGGMFTIPWLLDVLTRLTKASRRLRLTAAMILMAPALLALILAGPGFVFAIASPDSFLPFPLGPILAPLIVIAFFTGLFFLFGSFARRNGGA